MQGQGTFRPHQSEIGHGNPSGTIAGGFAELDHILCGKSETHMLPKPCRFAFRPAGMAEQTASPLKLAEELEEIERLGQ
ncbi:hypothetical protein MAXJ12_31614 [Mesorhizobium alhagi CCNWXJ12-2]|uniref:Uncharacterized protein n=1 Tax=Mesorhizobium alhagi CCNWXJ12-2 TaxID=1107882 RepID=H0I1I5_9HYPH|nr:hypothetical protein MAXJ12_31614 [Mesorhizobium alhagi CCNWXJ12-2]